MDKTRLRIVIAYYVLAALAGVLTVLIHGSLPLPGWTEALVLGAGVPLYDGIEAVLNLLKPDLPPEEKPAA